MHNGAPVVSIITPAYNAERFLEAAIASVLCQIFPDFELLIVDDGSADRTLAIAWDFARRDPRIRVFTQPRAGISSARNLAMLRARGRIFALLDSDDVWTPEFLETQLPLFDRFRVDVVTNNAWNLGGPWHGRPLHPTAAGPRLITLLDMLEREDAVLILAMFSRRVYDAIGGFDERLKTNEDYHFWIRAAHAGFRFLENPFPLAHYRRRPDSASADESFMTSGILRVLAEAKALCRDRPAERQAIDRQLARFEREHLLASAKRHLLRREYRAAALDFAELHRRNPTFASALVAGACRHIPRSLLGAYRLVSALRVAAARP